MRGSCRAAISCLFANLSFAQVVATPAEVLPVETNATTALEEITVTAQRREQQAQSVPIALTAFSAAQLASRQIHDVSTLRNHAPNMEIAPAQGNRLTASISIRGQVEGDIVPSVDPAVGLFLDGSYIARVTGANLDLVDIERVEVLRGPQGTLFGRNTIGGAINIVPIKPAKKTQGLVEIRTGNYDSLALLGVVNAPVFNESAAIRLAAQHTQHSGFGRSVVLNRDLSDDNTDFVRAQLRIAPADRWDLNFSFDFTNTSSSTQWITLLSAMSPATLLPAASGNPEDTLDHYENPFARETYASHAGGFDSNVSGGAANLTVEFDRFTLRAISAVRDLDLEILDTDLDGTPYDIATQLQHEQRQYQTSHELQVFGDSSNERFEWIGGIYYFSEYAKFFTYSNSLAPISPIVSKSDSEISNESRSAYLQLTANLAHQVRLNVGARYTEDIRQLTSRNSPWLNGIQTCQLDLAIRDSPEVCQATLPARHFPYAPFNVSIDYSPLDRFMIYAKYSRGFRAGGYNSRGTKSIQVLPFDPEKVDAYELGLKSDFFNDSLRFNFALFRSDYDDIQLNQVVAVDNQFSVVKVNAGAARIDGAELEVTAKWRRATIALAAGLIDARYTAVAPGVLNITLDSEFEMTPARTLSLAADLPFTLAQSKASLHAGYSWWDDVFYGGHPMARQDAYGVANMRLSMELRRNLELALWIRNVADTRYLNRAIYTGNGLIKALPGDPRTYGASLRLRFGAG